MFSTHVPTRTRSSGRSGKARSVLACAAIAAVVVGSACSGDDDDPAAADTTSAPPDTNPSTSAAPTTTDVAPATTGTGTSTTSTTRTTDAPTTTGATSSTSGATPPTTDESPSTTSVPPPPTNLMSAEAASAAVEDIFNLWTDCLAVMPDCDPVAVSTTLTMGPLSDSMYISASTWADQGATFDNLESRRIVIESAEINDANGTARVVTCTEDGAVRTAPDGSILNDAFVSLREEWELATDGSRWVGANSTELERALGEGSGLCDSGQ
jgi:hypothetical protein